MATTKSTQVTRAEASPQELIEPTGRTHRVHWDYTIAGAAVGNADVVELCKLPAGCRVIMIDSYLRLSATAGASTTLDIGYKAYKDKNGNTVAADPNGLNAAHIGTDTSLHHLMTATTAPLGVKVDGSVAGTRYGIADFSDAHEDVVITLTAADGGGTFDGDIGDVWEGWFTVESA